MIENSRQQLNFIDIYIAYCRLRLQMQQDNFFIESNKLQTATSVLHIAVMETLNEVNDMEKAIQELYTLVPKVYIKVKEIFFVLQYLRFKNNDESYYLL